MASKKEQNAADAVKAREALATQLKAAGTVYVVIASVSKSGMTRRMRFYVDDGKGLISITERMGEATGWHVNDDGLKVEGCGMDMVFAAVYAVADMDANKIHRVIL